MGSPYLHFALNRVNVVKSASGFNQLSNELVDITKSPELRGVKLVVEYAIRTVLEGREADMHYECYDAVSALRGGHEDAFKEYLWDLAHRNDIWTTFSQAYIDLCSTAMGAAVRRARVVAAIATSYEREETRVLDRAIVFDFTKKGI